MNQLFEAIFTVWAMCLIVAAMVALPILVIWHVVTGSLRWLDG